MIKAVIFDMDGVLIDSEPYYQRATEEYFASYGIRLTREQLLRFPGRRFLEVMEEIGGDIPEENYRRIIDGFVPWTIDFEKALRREVPQLFRDLRKMGLTIAIASNSIQEKLNLFLRRCQLEEYVELVCSGADLGRGKPEPDIYIYTCGKLSLAPSECVAVEDSDCGLQAAAGAGCRVVCLIDKRFAFRQENADIWIHNLRELPEAIKKINSEDTRR